MKHYFKWSTHIIIGLIVFVIALLLFGLREHLPKELFFTSPTTTSSDQ